MLKNLWYFAFKWKWTKYQELLLLEWHDMLWLDDEINEMNVQMK